MPGSHLGNRGDFHVLIRLHARENLVHDDAKAVHVGSPPKLLTLRELEHKPYGTHHTAMTSLLQRPISVATSVIDWWHEVTALQLLEGILLDTSQH
jgi:hypothetical protein